MNSCKHSHQLTWGKVSRTRKDSNTAQQPALAEVFHARRALGKAVRRVPLLVEVDLAVPAAPDLGGREHAAATAHVAKGALAGAVCAAAWNAGDTGDGAPGTP